jgi:hypothetical protein
MKGNMADQAGYVYSFLARMPEGGMMLRKGECG